jgi:hypothetical protein
MPRRELLALLERGHAIDARQLDDSEYRGVSLGMPGVVDRLTWKVFRKAFHRDLVDGSLRGWNVRLEQTGVDGPSVPLLKRGAPVTFGHFEVTLTGNDAPHGLKDRLLLDYSLGRNHPLDPTSVVRDVLVAFAPNEPDRLFGWMYLELGRARAATPSFFVLEREGPLSDVVRPPRG